MKRDYLKEYKKVEEAQYNKVAHLYDQVIPKKIDLNKEEFVQFKLLKEWSSKKNYGVALDLACGTGRYVDWVKCKKLYGLDLSKNMLAQAKKKRFNKPVVWVKGDMFHLPFRDKQFDLVYSIGTLGYHAPVTEDLLRQVKCVLKPGGTLIFTSNVGDRLLQRVAFWVKDLIEYILPFCPGGLRSFLIRKIGFGRYTHTQAYLLKLLKEAGFSVIKFGRIMPRVWPQYFVVAYAKR